MQLNDVAVGYSGWVIVIGSVIGIWNRIVVNIDSGASIGTVKYLSARSCPCLASIDLSMGWLLYHVINGRCQSRLEVIPSRPPVHSLAYSVCFMLQ